MTHDEAFLRDMREHPEDDAPRLVYADWLDEQDDPRGRYLRAEVELARLGEGDEGYAALEAELQELRQGIEPEWLAAAGKRWDLYLCGYPPVKKIQVIKLIRELTGCGLKEAKDLAESPPPVCLLRGQTRPDAERAREHLSYSWGEKVAEAVLRPSGSPPAERLTPAVWSPRARYQFVIRSYPPANRLPLLMAVREMTSLGLAEVKELCDNLPAVLPGEWGRDGAQVAQERLARLAEVAVRELPNSPAQCPAAPPGATFELVLHAYPPAQKIMVIKALREVRGLGLKECKDLAEQPLPVTVWTGLTRDEAERALGHFAGAAEVEVRAVPPA